MRMCFVTPFRPCQRCLPLTIAERRPLNLQKNPIKRRIAVVRIIIIRCDGYGKQPTFAAISNLRLNLFSHDYKKYKNGKIIIQKNFDDEGTLYEYVNNYNDNGKLLYVTFKNPNSWKKVGENSWGYGVQDSIGVTYKSLINEYDKNNKLIKTQKFDLYSDETYKNPVKTSETIFKYDGNNLMTQINSSRGYQPLTYVYYKYDKKGNLNEKYCCDEDISKAKIIEKYFYKNDKIVKLNYSEESFNSQKNDNYNISYSYKFDNNKNWVEIIKTVNGIDLFKWVREIEYY